MRIWADFHTHTRFSHGKGSVEDNARAAAARGLKEVGIADHGPRSLPWVRTEMAALDTMLQEVEKVNQLGLGVRVRASMECNIIGHDGSIDLPPQAQKKLDFVLAGLHPTAIPRTLGDTWFLWVQPNLKQAVWRRRARAANTKAVVEAVNRHDLLILTHPGAGRDIDTAELARACARRGTAMEINAHHNNMTVDYCLVAAREGARFALSSDAHRPEAVGAVDGAIAIAQAAGLTPDQIINCCE